MLLRRKIIIKSRGRKFLEVKYLSLYQFIRNKTQYSLMLQLTYAS